MNEQRLSKRLKKHLPMDVQEYLSILGDGFAKTKLEDVNDRGIILKNSHEPILSLIISLSNVTGPMNDTIPGYYDIQEKLMWYQEGGYWDWLDNHDENNPVCVP